MLYNEYKEFLPMSANLLALLNELFDESLSTPPTKEALTRLMDETFSFIQNLKEKFDSKDPSKKDEAVHAAQEMKNALEEKLGSLKEKLGIDPSALTSLFQDANGISDDEKEILQVAKDKLEQVQKSSRHPRTYKPIIR